MKAVYPLLNTVVKMLFTLALLNAPTMAHSAPPRSVTELVIIDTKIGTGTEAAAPEEDHEGELDILEAHYTGWIYDPKKEDHKGRKFDSSYDKGIPIKFRLGGKKVVPGWTKGLDGMKVGGTRTLIIPPELGYGSNGIETKTFYVPTNVPLIFDIELISVLKPQ